MRILLILVALLAVACGRTTPKTGTPVQTKAVDPTFETEKILENWAGQMYVMAKDLGYVPANLNEIPADGWGRSTRYARINATTSNLCSAGLDGVWDTNDDTCQKVISGNLNPTRNPDWTPAKMEAICTMLKKGDISMSMQTDGKSLLSRVPAEMKPEFIACSQSVVINGEQRAIEAEAAWDIHRAYILYFLLWSLTDKPNWSSEAKRLEKWDQAGAKRIPVVRAGTVYKDFESNEIAAEDKYKGWFLVVGNVRSVATTFDGSPYVEMATGTREFRKIQCLFSPGFKSRLRVMKKDEQVQIPCRGGRRLIGNPVLECRLGSTFLVNKDQTEALVAVGD